MGKDEGERRTMKTNKRCAAMKEMKGCSSVCKSGADLRTTQTGMEIRKATITGFSITMWRRSVRIDFRELSYEFPYK